MSQAMLICIITMLLDYKNVFNTSKISIKDKFKLIIPLQFLIKLILNRYLWRLLWQTRKKYYLNIFCINKIRIERKKCYPLFMG